MYSSYCYDFVEMRKGTLLNAWNFQHIDAKLIGDFLDYLKMNAIAQLVRSISGWR